MTRLQPPTVDRYFLDTEFIEDGKTIDLISIGIVRGPAGAHSHSWLREDELYLCNANCDRSRAGTWVREHVFPQLPVHTDRRWVRSTKIAEEVRRFVRPVGQGKPEIWAYYADYDWVALCQLFGRMLDLPDHFPMFCMDLKQLAVMAGSPRLPKQRQGEHDALEDARWNSRVFDFLVGRAPSCVESWWPGRRSE